MSDDFQSFGVQYQFTESIGNSLSAPFRAKEEIIAEYEKRGFHDIELRNAVDPEGNILAYTFNVYCYKQEGGKRETGSGFVRYDDFMKTKSPAE